MVGSYLIKVAVVFVCLFVCLFAGHHLCAVLATATHSCSLDDNNLGPEGAAHLAPALASNTSLTVLA